MALYSQTRWWSRWKIIQHVLEQFGDVEPFLQENVDLSAATRTKLLEILHDPLQLLLLKVELAAIVDTGVHFVRATYSLEDGSSAMRKLVKLGQLSHLTVTLICRLLFAVHFLGM